MKGWKMAAAVSLAAAAAEYGVASYFFNRTMVRKNAATERTMDMAGTDWDQYMDMIREMKSFMAQQPREEVSIQSKDGLRLHGTYFPGSGGKKLVLCFHGYTSNGISGGIGLANYYLPRGYRLLLVDARAHGDSEGEYIGFGCLDRFDALAWIQYIQSRFGESCDIWLHGTSMGGATALMTAGLPLPEAVKGIISDCAFTSAWEVFAHVLKSQYHLPAIPLLTISDWMTRWRAGYGLNECNAAREVRKAKVPILLIHGDSDTFVPCAMCYEIYQNCASPSEIMIVHGAGHCEAFYKEREAYEKKLTEFFEREEFRE